MRECSGCGEQKALNADNFRPVKDSPGAFRHLCRRCESRRNTESGRRKRGLLNGLSKPTQRAENEEPSFDIDVDPLAEAYHQREKREQKRTTEKQRDALLDENDRLRKRISELVEMQSTSEIIVYDKPKWERCDAIPVGVASDWHSEEEVKKESVHGLNEFNLDIATKRAEKFFQNLLRLTDMMARDSKINALYLAILGDTLSNWIHEELMAACLLAPGAAAQFVKSLFVAGIDFLLRESSYVIRGKAIPGNHGRLTKFVHHSDPTGTSLETFMYRAIAEHFRGNPRVQIEVSDHAMQYEHLFERFVMRLIHGYEVKFGGGVGGITIPIRKALAQWNEPIRADVTVMGHFHQFHDGNDFVVNGSLIGYNTYAQSIKAKYEPPTQAFFLVHARNGGEKVLSAKIWLDDADEKRAENAA